MIIEGVLDMQLKAKIIFSLARTIILISTFIPALYLENAGANRKLYLLIVFALINTWFFIREWLVNKYIQYSFIVDVVLLLLLESQSKYVVNYYFSVYYFIIVITAGLLLKKRAALIVNLSILIISIIKYGRLILQGFNYASLSYAIFYILSFIILIIIMHYSKHLFEERTRINELYGKLTDMYKELQNKNERIQELTKYEERNRIAREIHDSLGHGLTGLIMQMEVAQMLIDKDKEKAKEQLKNCRQMAKNSMADIRKSVMALKPGHLDKLPLIQSIGQLIDENNLKLPSTRISLYIKGKIYKVTPIFNLAIYRAVQECITNAIRHGQATGIDIIMDYQPNEFLLQVKDNGKGSVLIKEGYGLSGMRDRIREIGGTLEYRTEDSFEVNIGVPINSGGGNQNG